MNYNVGDHLKVKRMGGTFTHHGVYIGDNRVLHLTGEYCDAIPVISGGSSSASIQIDSLEDFNLGGYPIIVNSLKDDIDKHALIEEIYTLIGPNK